MQIDLNFSAFLVSLLVFTEVPPDLDDVICIVLYLARATDIG
jgi:hypothetical protein